MNKEYILDEMDTIARSHTNYFNPYERYNYWAEVYDIINNENILTLKHWKNIIKRKDCVLEMVNRDLEDVIQHSKKRYWGK